MGVCRGPEWGGLGHVWARVGGGDVLGARVGVGVIGCRDQSGGTWRAKLGVREAHGARVGVRGMQGQSGVLQCRGARVRDGVHGGLSRGRGWGHIGPE